MLLLQAERKLTGIMNFTNPGCVSHNEVSAAPSDVSAHKRLDCYSAVHLCLMQHLLSWSWALLLPYVLVILAYAAARLLSTCCVSAVQILEMYKQYIDPEFTWSNFTLEEQAKVIVAPRSNNLLDTQRVSGGGLQARDGVNA
jgi:hypothetical protein